MTQQENDPAAALVPSNTAPDVLAKITPSHRRTIVIAERIIANQDDDIRYLTRLTKGALVRYGVISALLAASALATFITLAPADKNVLWALLAYVFFAIMAWIALGSMIELQMLAWKKRHPRHRPKLY